MVGEFWAQPSPRSPRSWASGLLGEPPCSFLLLSSPPSAGTSGQQQRVSPWAAERCPDSPRGPLSGGQGDGLGAKVRASDPAGAAGRHGRFRAWSPCRPRWDVLTHHLYVMQETLEFRLPWFPVGTCRGRGMPLGCSLWGGTAVSPGLWPAAQEWGLWAQGQARAAGPGEEVRWLCAGGRGSHGGGGRGEGWGAGRTGAPQPAFITLRKRRHQTAPSFRFQKTLEMQTLRKVFQALKRVQARLNQLCGPPPWRRASLRGLRLPCPHCSSVFSVTGQSLDVFLGDGSGR